MRAEIQGIVAEVEKSLVLLAQRMDRETAPHRLEEFNARVEDPTLWDNPENAQKLMRERQALVDAMESYDTIAGDLSDNIELIELGEMEGDAEVIKEAEEALKSLKKKAAEKELEALLDGEAKELILQNDEATNKLGKDIANEIKLMKTASIEIHLEGDLGAGKTFLSRSIIKSCGWSIHSHFFPSCTFLSTPRPSMYIIPIAN